MKNRELYNEASNAIRKLFYDTSSSIDKCRANMENLKEEIEVLLEAIRFVFSNRDIHNDDGGE